MEDQSKKTLIVAAVASLASVALTYLTLNKVTTEPEKVKDQMDESKGDQKQKEAAEIIRKSESYQPIDLEKLLREDLFIIGNIEPDEDNLLSFSDFDRMFRIIQKHATFRVCQELEQDAEQRIKLLDKEGLLGGQSAHYRKMALDSMRKEERVYEELTQAVCEALDLDFGVFEHTMAEILPMNQHNYTLTRSQIEEKRQQWLLDHTDQGRKQDQELTREFVLSMFYEQQAMNRESWTRLARVRDESLREEHHVEQILIADRLTLKYKISAQMYDHQFRKFNLDVDPDVQAEIERSRMPEELTLRIIQSQDQAQEEDGQD